MDLTIVNWFRTSPEDSTIARFGNVRTLIWLVAVAATLWIGNSTLLAADKTWDNGSTDFTWNTSSLNWGGAAWNNAAGDGAIFGATGAGAINVPGPINVNSMSFTENGYSLTGAGPITFVNGASTQTTGVVNVPAGISTQINVPLNSAVGFQKIGAGTLELTAAGSYTAAIPLDPRATLTAGLLIGGAFGTLDGGTLRVSSDLVVPNTTDVSIGQGYLDIGNNTVTLGRLNFINQNPNKPWNTTLNANNGVVGSGTLRVLGEINVLGAFGDNFGNSIAANVDLGGGTQIVRIGAGSAFGLNTALMFTGVLSNGSLFKSVGYNPNGVLTTTDGIGLYNNNTYTGSTILNGGQSLMAGTNATSSIKITGGFGAGAVSILTMAGANGSAQGATVLQSFEGGTLLLDNNAAFGTSGGNNQPFVPAAQNNDRIRDDAVIELRNASFIYRGLAGSTTATETFGSLHVLGGHNSVTIQPNNLGAATITGTGNLTMAPRSTLQVQTVTTGTGNSGNAIGGNAQLKFNGTVPAGDATGILPRVVSSADFLTYNASTGLTPFTGYAPDFSTPGTNVSIAAATNVASSVNVNALRQTSGSAVALTIGAGETLGITSGMILNSGFGALTISGGNLDFGSNPGVLFATGAITLSGAVTGSAGLIHARGTATYSGDFTGLTGPVDIYSGSANLNTNTMYSPINVRNGTLNINVSQTAAGLGAITLGVPETANDVVGVNPGISISGAGANADINRDLIVDNGATNVAGVPLRYSLYPGLSPLSNSSGSQTWSGNITLNTGLRIQGGGASATSTGATNFTGNISGPATFYVANGRVNYSGNYSNDGGFLIGDQGFTAKVAFLGTGSGNGSMLISGGNSNTVSYNAGALQGGAIRVWNSSATTAPQIIPLENSTIHNDIVLGIGPKPGDEGNAIANVGTGITAEWAGPLKGFSPLTKIGNGALVLSNASNTHTGPVMVNVGTLQVDGMLPSSSVSVASSATLGGIGVLTGDVSVAPGGVIAPGNSLGNLTTGNLAIQGTFQPEIDLNHGGMAAADLLTVVGNVGLTSATLDLLLLNAPAGGFGGGTYLLVANDGLAAVSGNFNLITGLPMNYSATIDYAFSGVDSLGRMGNGNDIAVTIIPEPACLAILFSLGALALRRRHH